MKKLLAISAAAMMAILVVAPAVRAEIVDLFTFQEAVDAAQAVDATLDPPPNNGAHDFVVGGFTNVVGERIGLSAHSSRLGDKVSGHESVTFPTGAPNIRAKVVCLAVVGKAAAWGIVVTDSKSNTLPPGTEFVEFGRDGGPGGLADGWGFVAEAPADSCGAYVAAGLASPPVLVSGNLLIHDAT